MGFGAILGLLSPIFSDLIKRIFPDPEKQAEAEARFQELALQAQQEADKVEEATIDAKKEIITTEMGQGGWASQWRAYLMMICVSVVAYNWIIVSFLNAFLKPMGLPISAEAVPPELWTLVTIGLGGYYTKEAVSIHSQGKVDTAKANNTSSSVIDEDKLAKALRKNLFTSGMTEAQWQAVVASAKESVGEQ
jgi:hypothetical protein